jgi:hypothetical protein
MLLSYFNLVANLERCELEPNPSFAASVQSHFSPNFAGFSRTLLNLKTTKAA